MSLYCLYAIIYCDNPQLGVLGHESSWKMNGRATANTCPSECAVHLNILSESSQPSSNGASCMVDGIDERDKAQTSLASKPSRISCRTPSAHLQQHRHPHLTTNQTPLHTTNKALVNIRNSTIPITQVRPVNLVKAKHHQYIYLRQPLLLQATFLQISMLLCLILCLCRLKPNSPLLISIFIGFLKWDGDENNASNLTVNLGEL